MYINFLVLKFQDENYTVWSQRENTTYLKSEQQFETFHGMAGFAPGGREDTQEVCHSQLM